MGRCLTALYYLALGPATIAGAGAALAGLPMRGPFTLIDLLAGIAYASLVIGGALFTCLGAIEVRHARHMSGRMLKTSLDE
jgi:hypothetical protein